MSGRSFLTKLLLSALIAAGCSAGVSANDETFSVGVAKVDITPTYPVRLNGFGFRREESEGITQQIWAKALAIGTDDQHPLVLVTLDNLGIRLSMVEEVATRLKKKAGIQRERFAVTFSHSHTTPKVEGAADTIFSTPIPPEHQERIERYTQELANAIEQVALAALDSRRPCRLEWGVGHAGFAMNRRTPDGPVDHSLPTLIVRSVDDDVIRAIYTTYACHCVSLRDNMISGDWAGYAQRAIETKHPQAIALVSIGCGSDANPTSRVSLTHPTAAFEQGAEIAEGVERLLTANELRPVSGPTTAVLQQIPLPLEPPPSRAELEQLASQEGPASYNAQFQLAKLDRDEPLLTEIDYPIQTWSFGNSLSMVFLAGEVCVDYALRLRQELDSDRLWVHGYSNDFCCYIPSERLLNEGGYGGGGEIVYFALPSKLAPGLEKKIVNEVLRQVPEQYHRSPTSEQGSSKIDIAEKLASSFQLSADFEIELVAVEPLIVDPVAIDFHPDGRLWVVEMPDYSRETDEEFTPHGTVKLLTDRDGDGLYDEASTLADDLQFPTDVKMWKNGVMVCDAPDVIYLEDTDGDGRADVRKTLLTGFATHNPQARVNSLRWGLDNWLHGSCGLFGGQIKSFSGATLDLGARDFRFHPATGDLQPVAGRTQQGRARDDWGNWFGCRNSSLALHYPLDQRYLRRNPFVAPPADEVFVPSGHDPNQLFPVGEVSLFKLSGPPGHPTSVCGLEIYRDDLLGSEFAGNLFVAESVNGLIHRLALTPRGVTFSGSRPPEEKDHEFLTSTDPWFRPVQIRTGLEGSLWIVDMHRAVIEHKRFIPEETLREIYVFAGNHQGRIYRISPRSQMPRSRVRLDQLDGAGLASALDSPNGPLRDLAHQMIVNGDSKDAVPELEKLVITSERAVTRLHALSALEGLEALRSDLIKVALSDPHPEVRRHAIRFGESFLNDEEEIASTMIGLISDEHAQVVLQLAYSLGEWHDSRAAEPLIAILEQHANDAYFLAAVLSSLNRHNIGPTVQGMLASASPNGLPPSLLKPLLISAAHLGDLQLVNQSLSILTPEHEGKITEWRLSGIASLLEALHKSPLGTAAHADQSFRDYVKQMAIDAVNLLDDPETDPGSRIASARILVASSSDADEFVDQVATMVSPQLPPAVQQAGIELLSTINTPVARAALLERWSNCSPSVRTKMLDSFLGQEAATKQLLASIAVGEVKPGHLDAASRQRLLDHPIEACRAEARRLLSGAIDTDRSKVLQSYSHVQQLSGDTSHGQEIFRKHCTSCHKFQGEGHAVGPDFSTLTNRTSAMMLEALFDPNRAIDERYQKYIALTDEGMSHSGILVRETSHSVTLLGQEGKEQTLLRSALESFENTGSSLMPEGFEKDLTAQDVADLLAYLEFQDASP